jgi:amino acid adenylation domain-containing protein
MMNTQYSEADQDLSDEDREILAYLLEQEEQKSAGRFRISPAGERDGYPLSFGQLRLWFLDQMEPGNPAYHFAFRLRFDGAFDDAALRAAIDDMLRRHSILRARFIVRDGEAVQVIDAPAPIDLPVTDLGEAATAGRESATQEFAAGFIAEPFDLARGPVVRFALVRLAADVQVCLVCMHHIVTDRWSMGVFHAELGELYRAHLEQRAPALLPLPLQYTDYAVWESQQLDSETYRSAIEYWRGQLAFLTTLALPTDRARPAIREYDTAKVVHRLSAALSGRVAALLRENEVTPFMAYLTAFAILLHRYSGQSDIAIGTPVANRNVPELESLIGYFTNTLVLRVDLSGQPDSVESLSRVRQMMLDAFRHDGVPFERLVEELAPERDLSRSPLFQVLFVHIGELASASTQGGSATVQEMPRLTQPDKASTDFDLEAYVSDSPEGTIIELYCRTDIFDASTIQRLAVHFERVLQAMVHEPALPVARLPLVREQEARRLADNMSAPMSPVPETAVTGLISSWAQRTPDAPAVTAGKETLSFAELDRRSGRLAQRLRRYAVGAETVVGLCLPRSVDLVVGVLGIMRAGGAYVPLDPDYPPARLAFMLEDAGVQVLVSNAETAGVLPSSDATIVEIDVVDSDEPSTDDALPAPTSGQLAYMIYTSGSTGRPKGVRIEHRSLTNFVLGMSERVGFSGRDALLSVASLSFDASVLDLYVPLSNGGRLILVDRATARDGAGLAALIASSGATVMHATPATWQLLVSSGWQGAAGLRALSGGEALLPSLAQQLRERTAELWNLYGPTETTVYSSVSDLGRRDSPSFVDIGRPIANTRIYVLDDALQPVPPGVVGELCIAGAGVARDYLNRPELTAERFVADTVCGEPGWRLYRTGDLARVHGDGRVECLGRADTQVKLRGFRIELGEIESVLSEALGIRQAVALVREDLPGDRRLVAYVVVDEDAGFDSNVTRDWMAERLPRYMIPSLFVTLPSMPLTPSAKVDRLALPPPARNRPEATRHLSPETEMEKLLAAVWCELLGVERVGADENFFDLGGHSLLAVKAIFATKERTGIVISPAEYMMQNLSQIAKCYENQPGQPAGGHLAGLFRMSRRRNR